MPNAQMSNVQAAIRAGLRSNPLFEPLAPDLLQKIVDAMGPKEHAEGSVVIRQVWDHVRIAGWLHRVAGGCMLRPMPNAQCPMPNAQ